MDKESSDEDLLVNIFDTISIDKPMEKSNNERTNAIPPWARTMMCPW